MSTPFPKIPPRLALPQNPPKEDSEVIPYLRQLTEALQSYINQMAAYVNTANGADVIANRPAAGLAGRTFYGTDNLHFYVDNGSSWVTLI